jgi:UDP-N-acetylmuramoyl-L-alanyl-D-glutamate--2,6-diaminopimelate ligase
MRLDEVIPGVPRSVGDTEITDLAYDNRRVTPGTLFFCVPGFTRDGHEFAPDAIARGAAALVVERPLNLGVPEIQTHSVREAMAPAAAAFYGHPTQTLQTVGVTGTNGKTTTTFLLRGLLEADGRQTGLLGTVTGVIGGVEHPVERTTPEAIDLQRTFRTMLDQGDRACAMEVSSHALELHRADAIQFAAAIFTNLTQDHLDFHPTMEEYFVAKRRLFELHPEAAIVNVDDEYGARLAAELEHPITFGLKRPDATYRAVDVETDLTGSRFTAITPDGEVELTTPLRGRFNVYNALGAFAAARALGVGTDTAARAIATAGQVPGRFEPVDEGQGFAVLVDYAHTPDSLENVLVAARGLTAASGESRESGDSGDSGTEGRLHVVFGCGGDRDKGKRPLMGEIARRLADRVIVTSDNPRSEDPEAIIEEILAGAGHDVEHTADRRAAIGQAIATAAPGDVVVVAGKGHEQGQEFAAGRKVPFDDVAVAREALRAAAALAK